MEKQIHCKIQLELYRKLKEKAKSLNISMGAVIRIALTEYLNKKE